MKNIYLLFCLFLLSFSAVSQSSKNTIFLSAGPSFPLGSFASASSINQTAGYAKMGTGASLSYSYKLKGNWALEAALSGSINRMNQNQLENQFSQVTFFPQIGSGANWHVKQKSWKSAAFMLGLSHQLRAGERFSITPRVLYGLAHLQAPGISSRGKMPDAYIVYEQGGSKSFGSAFLLGSRISYRVSQKVAAHINIEYYKTADLTFKDVTLDLAAANGLIVPGFYDLSNSKEPLLMIGDSYNYKQSLANLNATLGIGFSF